MKCIDPHRSNPHLNSEAHHPATVVKNPHLCSNPEPNTNWKQSQSHTTYFHCRNIWNTGTLKCCFRDPIFQNFEIYLALLSLKLGVYGNVIGPLVKIHTWKLFQLNLINTRPIYGSMGWSISYNRTPLHFQRIVKFNQGFFMCLPTDKIVHLTNVVLF